MRRGTLLALLMAGLLADLSAQAPAPVLTFEVASIRAASFPPGRGGGGAPKIDGARMDLPFVSLSDLLPYAFRVKDYQISAPSWVRESRWTISAKLPDGVSPDRAPEMMQALLTERFKLTTHREKREQPVYTLTVGPAGSTLEADSPENHQVWDGSFPGFSFRGPLQSGAAITGRISPGANCTRRYEFVPLPMSALADALTLFMKKPVVDQTGMMGNYKVTLTIPAEAEAAMMLNIMGGALPPGGGGGGRGGGRGGPGGDPIPPPPDLVSPGCPDPVSLLGEVLGPPDAALIKAVQQLGLKLQIGRAPIETIVVDRLEKTPTEN